MAPTVDPSQTPRGRKLLENTRRAQSTVDKAKELIKQRQDAIEQFKEGGRDDLIAKDNFQLELYRSYQPEQLSEAEIAELVELLEAVGTQERDVTLSEDFSSSAQEALDKLF